MSGFYTYFVVSPITEQAMIKYFGCEKFECFKLRKVREDQAIKKMINDEKSKLKSIKKIKNGSSMNEKEEKIVDSWVSGNIKGVEVKSFSF